MLVDVTQRSPEWFDARRGLLTASIAAACLGTHPYISRQEAYRTIIGQGKSQDNADTRFGVEYEQQALDAYEVATGRWVTPTSLWVHDDHPWLGASPDGLVGDDGLVEAKCPRQMVESIPAHHRIQMAVQMACTNRSWCDYVSYVPPTVKVFRQDLDAVYEQTLIERLQDFMTRYVQPRIVPERAKKGDKHG